MPKSRGRKPKKPRAPTKGAPKQLIAQILVARAANPGADSPTGTINTSADGATGIINTAADTPPVHPEMDNEICEARVGSSRHATSGPSRDPLRPRALPANPRDRRAIIIGGSIATHLKLLKALDSIIGEIRSCLISVIVYDPPQDGYPFLAVALSPREVSAVAYDTRLVDTGGTSACARGASRPSALAVLRLFTGWTLGRSLHRRIALQDTRSM